MIEDCKSISHNYDWLAISTKWEMTMCCAQWETAFGLVPSERCNVTKYISSINCNRWFWSFAERNSRISSRNKSSFYLQQNESFYVSNYVRLSFFVSLYFWFTPAQWKLSNYEINHVHMKNINSSSPKHTHRHLIRLFLFFYLYVFQFLFGSNYCSMLCCCGE